MAKRSRAAKSLAENLEDFRIGRIQSRGEGEDQVQQSEAASQPIVDAGAKVEKGKVEKACRGWKI